jgi:hypothetical protein
MWWQGQLHLGSTVSFARVIVIFARRTYMCYITSVITSGYVRYVRYVRYEMSRKGLIQFPVFLCMKTCF